MSHTIDLKFNRPPDRLDVLIAEQSLLNTPTLIQLLESDGCEAILVGVWDGKRKRTLIAMPVETLKDAVEASRRWERNDFTAIRNATIQVTPTPSSKK